MLDETYTFGKRGEHTMRAYEISPQTSTGLNGKVLKFSKGVTARPSTESLYICTLLLLVRGTTLALKLVFRFIDYAAKQSKEIRPTSLTVITIPGSSGSAAF